MLKLIIKTVVEIIYYSILVIYECIVTALVIIGAFMEIPLFDGEDEEGPLQKFVRLKAEERKSKKEG